MSTYRINHRGVALHVEVSGPESGPPIIFSNALGTDLRIWDGVLQHLPAGLRLVRYDMRGHGQSDVPPGPYSMGALIGDVEAICDALDVKDAMFVGLSVGGMVGQGLAVKRLDLIRALVLSNTAAKIGTPGLWQDRIDLVRAQGLAALSEVMMQRWFGRHSQTGQIANQTRAMFEATPPEGYTGVCAAIAGSDFFTPTSGLRLPSLGIAGSEDGATPPDLVGETVALIPGSEFHIMRRLGHLPCVEDPGSYAKLLTDFATRTGHFKH